jgi:small-conductance mechanosensitive channel
MAKNDQQLAQKLSDLYTRLNLVFHAILALPLVAFVWLYLESKAGNSTPLVSEEYVIQSLNLVIPVLVLGLILAAFVIFKSGLRSINPKNELLARMTIYFNKSIVLFAMLEMALILSLVGYYLTQKDAMLAIYVIVLVFFSLYKPTLQRVSNQLGVKGEDKVFLIDCRRIGRGEEKEERNTHAPL